MYINFWVVSRRGINEETFYKIMFIYRISHCSHDRSLPSFLRCFTSVAVCVRVLTQAVDLLQQTKRHERAVELLQMLRKQELYHTSWRGRWCERLSLNLDFHLKKPGDVQQCECWFQWLYTECILHAGSRRNWRELKGWEYSQRSPLCSVSTCAKDLLDCLQQAEAALAEQKKEHPAELTKYDLPLAGWRPTCNLTLTLFVN